MWVHTRRSVVYSLSSRMQCNALLIFECLRECVLRRGVCWGGGGWGGDAARAHARGCMCTAPGGSVRRLSSGYGVKRKVSFAANRIQREDPSEPSASIPRALSRYTCGQRRLRITECHVRFHCQVICAIPKEITHRVAPLRTPNGSMIIRWNDAKWVVSGSPADTEAFLAQVRCCAPPIHPG